MSSTVYIVHCVDTEGPLWESLSATFERLRQVFHLELEPSRELLGQLQRGEVNLGGIEKAVQNVVDAHLLAYNDTWDKVDSMLRHALSDEYRTQMRDSRGGGWVYSWFCVDHVNYDVNPRRRDIGYHNIFDHYCEILRETNSTQDDIQFHYHPHAFKPHANICATRWLDSTGSLEQVLCRRIIDRNWFPAVNRPGFHVNRPDSHWFLEQYIPFDISNNAVQSKTEYEQQFDFSGGRYGDWRRAPQSWAPYHPAHDDYQTPGHCRRWIARCPNVGTRYYLLAEDDVRQAFEEAREGQPVVMAFTDHDFRDLR
ncbi:MAG: hypothetical protein IIA67_10135, partial [Planctomycetes bacterium]|nr:hypothetical protein [Planctomycetota bacterium]